jgi:long-chain-fatty-acid--[acyl-carrier-protein] ligase
MYIIGVRVDGLWGSMWSRAYTGKTPPFFKLLLKGIGYYFINLFFLFCARRRRFKKGLLNINAIGF